MFWIATQPIKRSDGKLRLRHKCVREEGRLFIPDDLQQGRSSRNWGRTNQNKSSKDNSYVRSSLRMMFGQSADLGETDIQGAIHVNVHTASVEQHRVYSIYYYGTLTLPCKRRGERVVGAVAVRVDSGREQERLLFYTCYRLLYILSNKHDSHSCIA